MSINANVGDSYNTTAIAPLVPSGVVPTVYDTVDYNDASTPAVLQDVRQFQNCVESVLTLNQPIMRSFRPKPTASMYAGVALNGFAIPEGPSLWIDTTSTGVIHYGWKAWVRNFPNVASPYSFRVSCRVFLACRRPR